MNTMLELSKHAEYDVIAACFIFAFAIGAKFWFSSKSSNNKTEVG